ncbi:hypothetical protein RhiirA4_528989 [Rhizophagus irregularis]|uniref:Uncharacterized protein n=1 Tax=Rhizophagus irregularis TaxID=588596 RepID=A0A2I1FZN9_9GLOM|nr:hypothetical protein RhiirA4_528989 [Rhizophagus irregularis]
MRHYGLLKKTYVKYGIFMEKQAEIIGWNDMLGSLMYLLIEISKGEDKTFKWPNKTRSSCKANKKTRKLTDIASNIISVTDSDHEEVEEMKMFNNENQRSCKGRNLTCIYCNGFHWVAYCDKIPSEFKGHCVKCWSSKSYQVKTCKFNARKEPWL